MRGDSVASDRASRQDSPNFALIAIMLMVAAGIGAGVVLKRRDTRVYAR